jgi:alpha-beta hydrolase superfamily lysophospholipase
VILPALSAAEQLALALSPAQLLALEKMLSGHTLIASADAAGVTRMTLYSWLHRDAKFQAAYNAWQLDALTRVRTKLLSMADIAANTIAQAIKSDARLAFAVLKALGGLDRPTPGSTNPEEVEQVMEIEQRKAEEKLGEELYWSSIGPGVSPPVPAKKPPTPRCKG